MPFELILPVGMSLAILAWSLIFAWYLYPWMREKPFADAVRPLLLLHAFRYIGLMFLIPGVTAQPLDPRFAEPAAYGDLLAAGMAFAALLVLERNRRLALGSVWMFNIFGMADLVNAVIRGLLFTPDGALGAAFWIPMTVVPLLLVSHGYLFLRLIQENGSDGPATI